jgi:hypothetical protein
VVPDPERYDRRVPRFERVQHQSVVEATRRRGVSDGRDISSLGRAGSTVGARRARGPSVRRFT